MTFLAARTLELSMIVVANVRKKFVAGSYTNVAVDVISKLKLTTATTIYVEYQRRH